MICGSSERMRWQARCACSSPRRTWTASGDRLSVVDGPGEFGAGTTAGMGKRSPHRPEEPHPRPSERAIGPEAARAGNG